MLLRAASCAERSPAASRLAAASASCWALAAMALTWLVRCCAANKSKNALLANSFCPMSSSRRSWADALAACVAVSVRSSRLLPRSRVQSKPMFLSIRFCVNKDPAPKPFCKSICDTLVESTGSGARLAAVMSARATPSNCLAICASMFCAAAASASGSVIGLGVCAKALLMKSAMQTKP